MSAAVRGFATVLVAVVLWPALQNFCDEPRDDFPLSYYPMFTNLREGRTTIYHAIGVRADGSTVDLDYRLAGSGGMNQVRRQMRRLVRDGEAARLAEKVAKRAAKRGVIDKEGLVAIEIVRDRFDLDEFFSADRAPADRKVYHRRRLERGGRR